MHLHKRVFGGLRTSAMLCSDVSTRSTRGAGQQTIVYAQGHAHDHRLPHLQREVCHPGRLYWAKPRTTADKPGSPRERGNRHAVGDVSLGAKEPPEPPRACSSLDAPNPPSNITFQVLGEGVTGGRSEALLEGEIISKRPKVTYLSPERKDDVHNNGLPHS